MRLYLVFCLLMCAHAHAQPPIKLRLGYFGPGVSAPGVRLSADYPLWSHTRPITRRSTPSVKTHQWLLTGSTGFYSRGTLQRGVFLLPQTGYEHIGRGGFTKTVLVGAGLLRLSTPSTRYSDTKGNTYRVEVPGESVLMKSVEVGLGWTHRPQQGRTWGWSVRPSAFWYRDRAGASSGDLAVSFDVHIHLSKP